MLICPESDQEKGICRAAVGADQAHLDGRKVPEEVSSVQFSRSIMSDSDPMNRSTPGFPVHHQFPEPPQTQVHHVSDAIQPSHPLLSPSPPTFNLSQHQGLFQ